MVGTSWLEVWFSDWSDWWVGGHQAPPSVFLGVVHQAAPAGDVHAGLDLELTPANVRETLT